MRSLTMLLTKTEIKCAGINLEDQRSTDLVKGFFSLELQSPNPTSV